MKKILLKQLQQGDVLSSTGLPNQISVSANKARDVFELKGEGRIQFFNLGVDNKDTKIIFKVDGHDIFEITPNRLFTMGVTDPNDFVWNSKFDETANKFAITSTLEIKYETSFVLQIVAPSSDINLLDFNIFYKDKIGERI